MMKAAYINSHRYFEQIEIGELEIPKIGPKDYTKFVYNEITERHGIYVVIDNVGQSTFPTSIRLLRPGGKLITCGSTTGTRTKVKNNQIFWKHVEIKGTTMRNQGKSRYVMKLIFKGN